MRARHHATRRSNLTATAVSLTLESLESRRLLAASLAGGVLTVAGSAGNDTINLSIASGNYSVVLNSAPAQLFAVASVDSIVIEGGDGNDWVFLFNSADPLQFNGGIGHDILEAGIGNTLDEIQGNVSFDGGAGADRADLWDNGSTGRTMNVSPTGITCTGWAYQLAFQSCAEMQISAGGGGDTFNLAQLPTGMFASIYGNNGDDTLNLATGTLDTIGGQVYFPGGDGFDFVNLDDQSNARNDNYSVTATHVTRFSNGVSPFGGLEYYAEQVMLLAGTGNNQVNVSSTAAGPPGSSLWVQGGNGNDTLFAGTGNLDNLAAGVHWDGNGGVDAVRIDDGTANTPRNFTVTNGSVTLTGNGTTFGGVYYAIAPQAETVELFGPSSAFLDNTFRVNSTAAGQTVTINAGTGDDSFILGGGSPITGAGANLANLAGALVLNGGSGGGGGGGGGGGATFDTITFNDNGNTFSDAFTITATTVTRTFWTGSVTFSGAEQLQVRAGDGSNAIHLQSIAANARVTIFGGGGNDAVDLAQQGQNLTGLFGSHAFFGGAGEDSLTLVDSLTNNAVVWSINPASVNRLPENTDPHATYAYEEFESLTLRGGSGGNSIVVNDTHAGTPVTLAPGSHVNGEQIDVRETAGDAPVTILPAPLGSNGPGVTVNTSGGGSATAVFPQSMRLRSFFIYDGGTASVPQGANALLHVTGSMILFPTGKLDLADNDLAIDYAGASPIGSWGGSAYTGFIGHIQRAHNGGTWDGAGGITTSTADALTGLTALGIAEASDVVGLSGSQTGTFQGTTVDATTVLIKYTYAGDANLDGIISGDDYASIDFNIAVPGARGWYNGDFNLDGLISGDDYAAIDLNIVAQGDAL